MKKFSFSIIAIVAFTLLFLSAPYSQSQENNSDIIELSDKQISSLGVKTQKLQKFSQHSIGNFPAKIIVPNSQIRIVNSPVNALVEQLFFATGNVVKKNQVVANIRSPELLTLNREILQAKSSANVANNAKKRANLLYKEGLISKAKLEQAISDADVANALLNERQAYLKLFQNQQNNENIKNGFLALTSPIDGVVMSKNVEIGQRIDAATMIYTIANLSTLNVEVQVPLSVAEQLHNHNNDKNTYKIEIAVKKGNRQHNIYGDILNVGQIADSAGKSVIVRGKISNDTELLMPNQSISVDIVSTNSENSKKNLEFLVENNAIIQNEQQNYIFLYNNKKFYLTPIRVVQNNGKQSLVKIKNTKNNANLNFDNLYVVNSGAAALKAMVLGLGGE